MIIDKIFINGETLYYYSGKQSAEEFYGYGAVNPASAATSLQEQDKISVYFYKNVVSGELSLHVIYNEWNKSDGSATMEITGLPDDAYVAVMDDPTEVVNDINEVEIGDNDIYYIGNGTFKASNRYRLNTDGFAIGNINGATSITLNLLDHTVLNAWKFLDSQGGATYLSIENNKTITFELEQEEVNNLINLVPEPSTYDANQMDINAIVSSEVRDFTYTVDGTEPVLSKNIAYDQLDPPEPFTTIIEDGGGNIVFDGAFTKIYNRVWNNSWTEFGQLTGTMKYNYNIINWISNTERLQDGNNKILVINDKYIGQSYSLTYLNEENGHDGFRTTLENLMNIMDYDSYYMSLDDFSSGRLNFTYNDIRDYIGIIFISSAHTSTPLITTQAIDALKNFRAENNGIFFITDHGKLERDNYTDQGFYRTVNEVIKDYNVRFYGKYDRGDIPVGYIRENYGDHPLFQNISDDETIDGGSSTSKIVSNPMPRYEEMPEESIDTGVTVFKFLITRNDGQTVSEEYNYLLNVTNPIDDGNESVDDGNESVDTFLNKGFPEIDIDTTSFDYMSGNMTVDYNTVGEVDFNDYDSINSILYYNYDQSVPLISNENLILEIYEPHDFSNEYGFNKFHSDIETVRVDVLNKEAYRLEMEKVHPFKITRKYNNLLEMEDLVKNTHQMKQIKDYMSDNTKIAKPKIFNTDEMTPITVTFSDVFESDQEFVEVYDTINCECIVNTDSFTITPTSSNGTYGYVQLSFKTGEYTYFTQSICVKITSGIDIQIINENGTQNTQGLVIECDLDNDSGTEGINGSGAISSCPIGHEAPQSDGGVYILVNNSDQYTVQLNKIMINENEMFGVTIDGGTNWITSRDNITPDNSIVQYDNGYGLINMIGSCNVRNIDTYGYLLFDVKDDEDRVLEQVKLNFSYIRNVSEKTVYQHYDVAAYDDLHQSSLVSMYGDYENTPENYVWYFQGNIEMPLNDTYIFKFYNDDNGVVYVNDETLIELTGSHTGNSYSIHQEYFFAGNYTFVIRMTNIPEDTPSYISMSIENSNGLPIFNTKSFRWYGLTTYTDNSLGD